MTHIPPSVLPPATVPAALPDIPGGQENLLPVAALGAPVRVEVARWSDDAGAQTLKLLWNGAVVAEKDWPGAVPDNELFILLPVAQLKEGVHELRYSVLDSAGESLDSEPLAVTIDTTEPHAPTSPAKLKFPVEVVQIGITRRYLDNNDNKVVAEVPAYDFQPGDRILCYWEEGPWGEDLFHEVELTDALEVVFDGDRIEAEGNGTFMVTYVLCDRAGNQSRLSAAQQLKVNIEPPQLRPFPWVVDAQPGNPGSISPINSASGMTVRVEPQDDIDSAQLTVHWQGFGEEGSYIASSPITVGGWDFRIPPETFPANFNREVNIHYSVEFPVGEAEVSEVYVLKISTIQTTKVGCAQSSLGKLSLAAVPSGGADLNLPPWQYKWLAASMRINLWMTGLDSADTPVRTDVLKAIPVDMDREPVTAKLPRAALQALKMNATFRLHAAVSFDDGETWLNFQGLDLNLVP